MKWLLRIFLVAVFLIASAGAYHGHNQLVKMHEELSALHSAIENNNAEAAGSLVMAHHAFANDISDLRHAIDALAESVNALGAGMDKLAQEHDHLHKNITTVMIKLNRLIKLHPSHKKAG